MPPTDSSLTSAAGEIAATTDPSATDVARDGASPLLFVFLLPMLGVIGLVLWIGATPTWLLVGLTIATIAAMTALVLVAVGRMLADDDHVDPPRD